MNYIRSFFPENVDEYGTHISGLATAIENTTGPILELGTGYNSTPQLNEIAKKLGRTVFSFDDKAEWLDRFTHLRTANHFVALMENWDYCPVESTFWGVAFVDHAPGERRVVEIRRLRFNACVLVVHDTEYHGYGYDAIFPLFKYRLDHQLENLAARTTLLSNYVDVSQLTL